MAEAKLQPAILSEFMSELRARGISIGIREHLVVAKLLKQWPGDLASMRQALGSLLGTDIEEAQLVRDTFDEIYPSSCSDSAEFKKLLGPLLTEVADLAGDSHNELYQLYNGVLEESQIANDSLPVKSELSRYFAQYWPGLAALLALLAMMGMTIWFIIPTESIVPPVIETPLCPNGTPQPCEKVPPEVPTLPPDPANLLPPSAPQPLWMRGAGVGGILALLFFCLLYWKRTGRDAHRVGYEGMALELESLDDPQTYEFDLSDAKPPFDTGLMDDVSMLLARQAAVADARHELDVEHSLDQTLEAGLAPRLVFASRTSAEPVLILEDISVEMRCYRRQSGFFLKALRERGVYIDHWQFDGDAELLTHAESAISVTFEHLIRQRLASPLMIISSGAGIIEPKTGLSAIWIGKLHHWLSCAWLHPSGDTTQWRQAAYELPVPIWPMNSDGLMSAARHLATGETGVRTAESRVLQSSPQVKPLHLTRLRRLIDLAPRREVGLAELLRQEFCPSVPESAVAEAVMAAPLGFQAAIGPSDQEVREFLIALLDREHPPTGSAAELRWQLDRALLGIHVPTERAQSLDSLAALVNGPLAAEVCSVVAHTLNQSDGQHIEKSTRVLLDKKVLAPFGRRALHQGRIGKQLQGKRALAWPKMIELTIAMLTFGAMCLATPWLGSWFNDLPAKSLNYMLELNAQEIEGSNSFQLDVSGVTQNEVQIKLWKDETIFANWQKGLELTGEDLGHWFWVSQGIDIGLDYVSKPIWIPAHKPRENKGPSNAVIRTQSPLNVAANGTASVYESSGRGLITPVSGANDTIFSKDKENNLMTITGQYLGIQIDLPAPTSLNELGAYFDPADRTSDRYKSTDQIEFFISFDNGASFLSVGLASFEPTALEWYSYGNLVGDFCQVTNIRYRFRQADKGREGQRILEVLAFEKSSQSADCSPKSSKTAELTLTQVQTTYGDDARMAVECVRAHSAGGKELHDCIITGPARYCWEQGLQKPANCRVCGVNRAQCATMSALYDRLRADNVIPKFFEQTRSE